MDMMDKRIHGTFQIVFACCFLLVLIASLMMLGYLGYETVQETLGCKGDKLYLMIMACMTILPGCIMLSIITVRMWFNPIKEMISDGMEEIRNSRISKSKEIVPYVIEPEVLEDDPNILLSKAIYSQTQELLSALKKGYPF
jgi:hypothetical protein